jgi:hypothetical protein
MVMNKLKNMGSVNKPISINAKKEEQFLYLGRWVNKNGFRAFVYDRKGNTKLANTFQEFEDLTSSGLWFASKPEASEKRKQHHDLTISNS